MAFTKIAMLSGCAFALGMIGANASHAGGDPTGVWVNDTGRGAIEIKPCGDKLCGHVVWLKDSADAKGCGKQIIGDARSVGGGRYDNGWIYSPERKRTYDVEFYALDGDRLRVTGYAGVKFLSKTMIWTKAPADLVRCDGGQPAANTPIEANAATGSGSAGGNATATAAAPAGAAQPAKPNEAVAAATANTAPATPAAQTESASAGAAAPASAPTPEAKSASGGDTATTPEASASGTDAGSQQAQSSTSGEEPAPRASSGAEFKTAIKEASGIDVDKFFKKSSNGKCKLDLPWVKVNFNCNQ